MRGLEAGSTVKKRILLAFVFVIFAPWHGELRAKDLASNPCQRPAAGSAVTEPEDLRSHNRVLKVDLTIHNYTAADGSTRYCYLDAQGNQSPNFRLNPGDLLILRLKNDLADSDFAAGTEKHLHAHVGAAHMN